MKERRRKAITLDEPATYEVVFAGRMEASSLSCGATVQVSRSREESCEATTVTGAFDQAALHGLIRSGYMRGFPLISVKRIETMPGEPSAGEA